ncbi:MAG: hypothetical protein QXM96_03350 [Candidatus Woesearchaeota archaeon]
MNFSLTANIKGIKYKPFLTRKLNEYSFENFELSFKDSSFIIKINDENKIALSWWVSPKRTRSYPYARVYDTLNFSGKKVTIIPIIKDEGQEGDRDFLQWDTISLMSLLGIYVIIGYYNSASKRDRYKNKITEQKFDIDFLKNQLLMLINYQSDALHWNLSQIDNIANIAKISIENYQKFSKSLNVKFHSFDSALKRIEILKKGKEKFMNFSRSLAEKAQQREFITIQPKENLIGKKAILTIKNYLGGNYYFTCDEVYFENIDNKKNNFNGSNLVIVEGKHSKEKNLPSLEDIKDGLLKMILFTNLENLTLNNVSFKHISLLKLTTNKKFNINLMNNSQKEILTLLKEESNYNNFKVKINNIFL